MYNYLDGAGAARRTDRDAALCMGYRVQWDIAPHCAAREATPRRRALGRKARQVDAARQARPYCSPLLLALALIVTGMGILRLITTLGEVCNNFP